MVARIDPADAKFDRAVLKVKGCAGHQQQRMVPLYVKPLEYYGADRRNSYKYRAVGHGDAEMDLIVLVEGVRHFIELEVEMGKTGGR